MKTVSLVLLLSFAMFISPSLGSMCKSDIRKLDNLLCHIAETMFKKYVPGASIGLYFIDQFYTSVNAHSNWMKTKAETEKWIGEKLESNKANELEVWHKSITARVTTCTSKSDDILRRLCFQNLQEDLSGYEPFFRGVTYKQKAMYLKYYDLFVVTYLSVSQMLLDLSNGTLKTSIENDVSRKAKLFYAYLTDAVPKSKQYACRIIKINIEHELMFWWRHVQYWPSNEVYETSDEVEIDNVLYRGCGPFKKAVIFQSTVVNTSLKDKVLAGPWKHDSCTKTEGIHQTIVLAGPSWKRAMDDCTRAVASALWDRINVRMEMLKFLF